MSFIESFSVYDFGTALKEDRVSSVVQLGIDEVVLFIEPPWGNNRKTVPTRVLTTRTAQFRRAGVSVCWAICPRRGHSEWVNGYRNAFEDARAIAKLDKEPLRLPTSVEIVIAPTFTHATTRTDSVEDCIKQASNWLCGDRDSMPFRASSPWRASFPSDVANCDRVYELVYDGRSSWDTATPAWRSQVRCGMPAGGSMMLAVGGQQFMCAVTNTHGASAKPLGYEPALRYTLDAATHAGARRVALWHLGELTDDDGALNKRGLCVQKATETRRNIP